MPHEPETNWRRTCKVFGVVLTVILFAAAVGVLLVMFVPRPSWAKWENVAGEWEPYNLTPEQKSWFKGVRSQHGIPCCDWADGHPIDYDIRSDGFWIPDPVHLDLPRQWIHIPPEAVVYNAGNPIGEAVVWFIMQGPDTIYVRCFVPAGGV